MLGYDKLDNFFKTNFSLVHHHKYSLSDVESMMPWERQIYVELIKEHIKQMEEKRRDQAALARRR